MDTLEREGELDRVAETLEAAASGSGRALVIEGPAGIGKTRLVEDARALAKVRGFGRIFAIGDELESALPWAVIRQLVERSISRYSGEDRERLLAGPSGAALSALDRAPDDARPGDAALARTLHALWWVAADLASHRPLLITVDDAQWADVPSQRFLAYLAPRIGDLPIALIVATRPPERSGPLTELAAGRSGDRIVPQPLSGEAIAALCSRDGEVTPDPAVVAAVHDASGGNPFLAVRLLDELDAQGLAIADARTAATVQTLGPSTISRALLGRLPADAVALAGAAAVLGARSDPQLAGHLAGVDPEAVPSAIDALVVGHVLTGDGDDLGFTHPVVREAVLAELGPGERVALHAAAARALNEAGAPVDRVAAHLAVAPAGTLPGSAPLLRSAAALLLAEGDAHRAAAYLSRAVAEEPGEVVLVAELGFALLSADDPGRARERLREAAAGAASPRERADRLAGAASATLALQGPVAAADELRRAVEEWPHGDDPARLVLEARLAVISGFSPDEIERSGERLEQFAGLSGSTPEERTLLAQLAQRGLYSVRPATEVAEVAARALADGAYVRDAEHGLLPWGSALYALVAADGVELAEAEIEHGRAMIRDGGSPTDFAMVSTAGAVLGWRRGHIATADTEAQIALGALAAAEPTPQTTGLRAVNTQIAVQAALERGEMPAGVHLLETFDRLAPDPPSMIPVSRLRLARAILALIQDDPTRARAQAGQLGDEVRRARMDTPTTPWRAPAAIAALRLGDEAEAQTLAAEQLALARQWGSASDVGASLRLNARVDADRRLDLLAEAIALLEGSPWKLELARALADQGEALRVARRRKDAREPLHRAAELADACGARMLRTRAMDGLAALGDRPRKLMFSGLESLTSSERRIAELAAAGRTNRDIAQELFITPKTAENHLGRVYIKLGIRGRKELAGALS